MFLRASQVGYRPGDPKLAVAFSGNRFDGTFRVVDAGSGEAVWKSKAEALPGAAWGRFMWHVELDFLALGRAGRFRLAVGDRRLLPFSIGDDVFQSLPDTRRER